MSRAVLIHVTPNPCSPLADRGAILQRQAAVSFFAQNQVRRSRSCGSITLSWLTRAIGRIGCPHPHSSTPARPRPCNRSSSGTSPLPFPSECTTLQSHLTLFQAQARKKSHGVMFDDATAREVQGLVTRLHTQLSYPINRVDR